MRSILGKFFGSFYRGLHNLRSGVTLGSGTRISFGATLRASGKAHLSIGEGCKLLPFVYIDTNGGSIEIGNHCHINPFAVLYSGKNGRLIIGNHVLIAAHAAIVASNHNFDSITIPISMQSIRSAGIIIEDDVWIAAGAKILDGVRVGKGSVVAAGAVVTKDVPAYMVVAGVPAKVIKRRGSENA